MRDLEVRGAVSAASGQARSELCLLVVFALDEQRYALFLPAVDTVVRAVEIAPLPKAPEIVLGVVNLRGDVIPVFDVRKRFQLRDREMQLSDQLVVAKASRRKVALLVDSVTGVVGCAEEEVVAATKVHPAIEFVEGIAKLDGRLILIHDLAKFLSLEEDALLDAALQQRAGEAE